MLLHQCEQYQLSTHFCALCTNVSHISMVHIPFLHLQVDNNQGPLLNQEEEKEDTLPLPTESLLKRQTATSYLKGQYQASVRQKKANQAKQNRAEQAGEVQGAAVSSQTPFLSGSYHHQPYTQTHLLPQPYSNPQSHHIKSSTLPSTASTDHPKVCFFFHSEHNICTILIDVFKFLNNFNFCVWSSIIHNIALCLI